MHAFRVRQDRKLKADYRKLAAEWRFPARLAYLRRLILLKYTSLAGNHEVLLFRDKADLGHAVLERGKVNTHKDEIHA